jgi:exopolysaccharide production protein ExoZ
MFAAERNMKLPNLQILRACAALMIVVHHCGIETARLAQSLGREPIFNEAPWGAGVSIFFAISGFIMVVTTAEQYGSAAAALDFMRRRIIRIVPLYWLVTTMALLAAVIAPSLMKAAAGDTHYVLSSYLFWPAMRPNGDIRPLATPGWSLNLEMFFYIVFAVCLIYRRRVGLTVLFVSLGALVAMRAFGLLPGVALYFWGEPVVLGFLLGALVGIAFNSGWRLSRAPALICAATGFGVLFVFWMPNGAVEDLAPALAVVVPAALILIGFALGPQVDERMRLWLPALIIGDASYSLYLSHEFLLRPLALLWGKGPLHYLPLWMFVPAGIAVAAVVAIAGYRWFEKPVTRRLTAAIPAGVVVSGRTSGRLLAALAAVFGEAASIAPGSQRRTASQRNVHQQRPAAVDQPRREKAHAA